MRFLADESCDFNVVRALRQAGHDVQAVADVARRAVDSEVIALALREGRVLLTEDKDFGQLVHASGKPSAGVLLLRYPFAAREAVVQSVLELVRTREAELTTHFVVVQPGRVRFNPLPALPTVESQPSTPPAETSSEKPKRTRRKKKE
jgi:predicted nuclease of predicted toxin-antitoxin system